MPSADLRGRGRGGECELQRVSAGLGDGLQRGPRLPQVREDGDELGRGQVARRCLLSTYQGGITYVSRDYCAGLYDGHLVEALDEDQMAFIVTSLLVLEAEYGSQPWWGGASDAETGR